MTVRELISKLQEVDLDLPVYGLGDEPFTIVDAVIEEAETWAKFELPRRVVLGGRLL
jgi:hypothetical protein